ncbi:sulfotransferase domain-containing protein [Salinibacter ruber]|uniref:sulfotransferase domain-containing protein n=1 Tax=Salinibacter ruber TaxID=146919 RepID=UPI002073AB48|nr:sulfotransferase domain-containing protein [Salinibacter ruber]
MDFIVVGAQKCATSWLYYCLRDHPEIHLPSNKREDVYLGSDLHRKYGTDWYFNQIGEPNDGVRVGDISVDYLFDPRSPKAISEEIPDTRIIASLRDPIDRAVSAYYWNLRRGYVSELDVDKGLSRAIGEWERRGPEQSYDPNSHYFNIIARGLYAKQLERYVDRIGTRSVYLLYYEDVKERPKQTLRQAFRALRVDPDFEPSSLSRRPKQNSYFRPLLRLERRLPNNSLFGKMTDVANQVLCMLGMGREKPSLSSNLEAELYSLYESQDTRLTELSKHLPRSNVLTPGTPTPPWIEVHA